MRENDADTVRIIQKYYEPGSLSYDILTEHGRAVAQKALDIAARLGHMKPDVRFIREAAMLHDIGIFMTDEPGVGCFGPHRYICHGYLGGELLKKEGLPVHASVCERHVGVGISIADIDRNRLPLPRRDMLPLTLEEKIICFADKFFSKNKDSLTREKPLEEVMRSIARYGADKIERFEEMLSFFG